MNTSPVQVFPIKIFGLDATKQYAEQVCTHLSKTLTPHEEKVFEDGECFLRSVDGPEGNVRGHNTFVIQSLYTDNEESVADKLTKLLIMCGSLQTASAHEIVAVIPFLGFSRQDRKTESRAPITTKIIAKLLHAAGATRILVIDVHNLAAIQNAFDIPIDNLECKNLHSQWCAEHLGHHQRLVVLSPDAGGYSRADRFRYALGRRLNREVGIAIFDKLRRNGQATGGNIVGDVEGAAVIILDDIISTAQTMAKAAVAVQRFGGEVVALCASHGLFVGKANQYLADLNTAIVVTDTVSAFRLNEENKRKLHVVDTTHMVAEAIWRIHSGTGSISELLR